MSELSDHELKALLQTVKQNLDALPVDMASMESELESAAKHVPAYVKVVKGHIDQLRKVLELENHNHRTLENAGLTAPVQQLINLFSALEEEDIQLLEELAVTAHNWQPGMGADSLQETNKAVFESAETTS